MSRSNVKPFLKEEFLNAVREWVSHHEGVLTPRELSSFLAREKGLDKKDIKSLINHLVSRGDLEYLDIYGRTCVAISFSRPVRISSRVVIKPPECHFETSGQDIVVELNKGIAFGRGTHPTTKLCLCALNHLFDTYHPTVESALDIGTGNGVLALTAVKFGAGHVDACDIDRVAVHETRENARINNVSSKITVELSCDFTRPRHLILANLRYPTLISMHPKIIGALSKSSFLILSGIKTTEIDRILSCYGSGMKNIWSETEGDWCSLIFRNR